MNADKRAQIFARFEAANPAPKTELNYQSTFQLLIAVLLSAQATDKSVNKATEHLFAQYGTPQALYKLGVAGIEKYIQTIGLYRTKAKNVWATSKILIDLYGGEVPEDREALEQLPGVGRKTANVVLNTAFGWPTIAVDTHIFRVSNRSKIAPGKDVVAVERGLEKFVPKEYKLNAHHWMILHGRYVCKASTPQCHLCSIADLCEYSPKLRPKQK